MSTRQIRAGDRVRVMRSSTGGHNGKVGMVLNVHAETVHIHLSDWPKAVFRLEDVQHVDSADDETTPDSAPRVSVWEQLMASDE